MLGPLKFVKALRSVEQYATDRVSDSPESQAHRSDGETPTVLCIHGFTGVPGEVRLVWEAAESLGLRTVAPLLAGHGLSAREFSKTVYEDWLEALKRDFDEARREGPVILVGLSLGSILATELLLSAPGDVAGIAFLSNAFWLRTPYPSAAISLIDHLGVRKFGLRKESSNLIDDEARASHVSYHIQPMPQAISLLRAGERMRERLRDVHRPSLVVHGARDQVCPVENSWKLAQLLGTRDRRVVILPESAHIITRDLERELLRAELLAFFQRLKNQCP